MPPNQHFALSSLVIGVDAKLNFEIPSLENLPGRLLLKGVVMTMMALLLMYSSYIVSIVVFVSGSSKSTTAISLLNFSGGEPFATCRILERISSQTMLRWSVAIRMIRAWKDTYGTAPDGAPRPLVCERFLPGLGLRRMRFAPQLLYDWWYPHSTAIPMALT